MRQSGFTLLELSIVLVIIGLIIGGVTVGTELIKATELQRVAKDFDRYKVAYQTFKLKYRYPPGDLPTAFSYFLNNPWPGGTCSNSSVIANGAGCNGDGNGMITENSCYNNNGEDLRSFHHLAAAGIIPGSFTQWHISGEWKIGQAGPVGPISGSGYRYGSTNKNCSSASNTNPPIDGELGDHIMIGSQPGGDLWAGGGIMTPAAAQSLDLKLDNGVAASGAILGRNPDCRNPDTTYKLTETNPTCHLLTFIR